MNEFFQPASVPAPNSPGASAAIRAEFASVGSAFDKLPTMAGSANEFVVVNATGTALIASGFSITDIVRINDPQTLTNKTLNWGNNTISTIPIAGGGTGATTLAGAKAALEIDLKADANNAVLSGAPTAPTPPTGNNSARIATTQFVQEAVVVAGGVTPSNDNPLMDGVAAPGVGGQVSRADHVHPSDTSRAPASAGTAAGTSFTPAGGVAATNVQAAIVELDGDIALKAPLASPVFTGNPTAPTPLTSDNDTSIATTAFVQSLIAQQPAGMGPSNNNPLMDGIAAPGTSVDASRSDHVHPSDTSRAPASAATAAGTSFTPAGGVAATNVQAAIAELDSEKAPASAGTASGTSFTPAGTVAATDVQAAIVEVAGEAAQKSSNLSDLANAATARTNLGIPASTQNAEYVTLGSVAGVDTITGSAAPAIAGYTAGQTFRFISAGANTGAATLNVNGQGAKALTKASATGPVALVAGDIPAAGLVIQVSYDGAQFQVVGVATQSNGLVSGTAINTTSGTAHDFTGIPSWVKKITLCLNDVSMNGSNFIRVQLGTSGGIVTSGYGGLSTYTTATGAAAGQAYSNGFDSFGDNDATNLRSGTITFSKLSGNIWTCSGAICQFAGSAFFTITFAGRVDLGATLTTLRFTNTGSNNFDNGSINILYE